MTISVGEEYVVLTHLGLTPIQQISLARPSQLDAITASDSWGGQSTVYFNPALHYLRLTHLVKSSGAAQQGDEPDVE